MTCPRKHPFTYSKKRFIIPAAAQQLFLKLGLGRMAVNGESRLPSDLGLLVGFSGVK